jgi:hypothetical protein
MRLSITKRLDRAIDLLRGRGVPPVSIALTPSDTRQLLSEMRLAGVREKIQYRSLVCDKEHIESHVVARLGRKLVSVPLRRKALFDWVQRRGLSGPFAPGARRISRRVQEGAGVK